MKIGIREFAFISLVLGLVAGSYAMVVRPHAQFREKQRYAMASMDLAVAKVNGLTAGTGELAAKVSQLQQASALMTGRVVPEMNLDQVLNEIRQTAGANSLQAGTVKSLKREKIDGIGEQPVELEFTGDFNGFYSFLLQMEKLPHLVRIRKMNVQKDDPRDGAVRALVTLGIFFQPDATE